MSLMYSSHFGVFGIWSGTEQGTAAWDLLVLTKQFVNDVINASAFDSNRQKARDNEKEIII